MCMTLAADLTARLSASQVSRSESVLRQHSMDESYHMPVLPDVVVFPECTKDVVSVIEYAITHKIPIVPFGIGSSLEGHAIPIKAGISMDMTRMNQILEIRPNDFLVHVQPGVTRTQLNAELKRYGLFFPVDPGADASLGGMAATNASGTTTVRYGAMRDNVRSLEIVLPNATVIQTASLAAKSSSGYNLTGLFVGSEGTLGVFTSIWLKVYGIPEKTVAARAEFPSIAQCVQASTAMIATGIPVARVELVDATYMGCVNHYKGTTYNQVPTLFLEFHGSTAGIYGDIEVAKEIAMDEGCMAFEFVEEESARLQLWAARHSAATAFMAMHKGLGHMVTDVCVPISQLPDAVEFARSAITAKQLRGAIIGHVGDGNYHTSLAVNTMDAAEMERAQLFNEEIVHYALAHGGTCTGEHGVGLGKRKYQRLEHGPALDVMQSIKRTIDVHNLFNPGKLVQ